MFESAVGLLSPWTRQNSGKPVNTWPVGVVKVPEVTSVAAVTVVLPSNLSRVSWAQVIL